MTKMSETVFLWGQMELNSGPKGKIALGQLCVAFKAAFNQPQKTAQDSFLRGAVTFGWSICDHQVEMAESG